MEKGELLTVKEIEQHANNIRHLNEIQKLYEKNIKLLESKSIGIYGIDYADHGDIEKMELNPNFPLPSEYLINGLKEALRNIKKELGEHYTWLMVNGISTIVED